MNQVIDDIYSTAKDGWGNITQTTVYSSVPCRWTEVIGKVVGPDREEKSYNVEVWITPDYSILYGYEFSRTSEVYKVVAIEKKYDIVGRWDHTKVFLI